MLENFAEWRERMVLKMNFNDLRNAHSSKGLIKSIATKSKLQTESEL